MDSVAEYKEEKEEDLMIDQQMVDIDLDSIQMGIVAVVDMKEVLKKYKFKFV